MHIDYYGMHIDIQDGPNRMARIGSSVDAWEFYMGHTYLKGGDICLVAGGGRGSVATWIAAKLGIYNTIVFEVIPDLWRMMHENIKFDNQSLPYLYWGALGTDDKDDGMFVPELYTGNEFNAILGKDVPQTQAPTVDTNKVIKNFGINALNLDIEGDEYPIIRHIDLSPLRVISMELHGPSEKGHDLRSYVESHGFYTTFWLEHIGSYPLQHITLVRS